MNLQEYQAKINELYKEIDRIKDRFIDEHKQFSKGNKVIIVSPNNLDIAAFVIDNKIENGKIEPIIVKQKKDGTPSNIRVRTWQYKKDKIVKL